MYISSHILLYKGKLTFSSGVNPSLWDTFSSKPLCNLFFHPCPVGSVRMAGKGPVIMGMDPISVCLEIICNVIHHPCVNQNACPTCSGTF